MAKKKLITEKDVLATANGSAGGLKIIYLPKHALVTALARDVARSNGVTFKAEADKPKPNKSEPGKAKIQAPKVIAIGADHGGFTLKQELIPIIEKMGWKVLDMGTHSTDSCDYPDYAFAVSFAVMHQKARLGIMIDGAGIGSAMVCNKVPTVRAACAYNEFTAWNARAHNNANVLTLGSRTLGIEVIKSIMTKFIETDFEGGRHGRRVDKITDLETHYPVKTNSEL